MEREKEIKKLEKTIVKSFTRLAEIDEVPVSEIVAEFLSGYIKGT